MNRDPPHPLRRRLPPVEHRWIAPVIVNPGHEGDWRETVWKLPPPESIPDTPVPRKTQRLDV